MIKLWYSFTFHSWRLQSYQPKNTLRMLGGGLVSECTWRHGNGILAVFPNTVPSESVGMARPIGLLFCYTLKTFLFKIKR